MNERIECAEGLAHLTGHSLSALEQYRDDGILVPATSDRTRSKSSDCQFKRIASIKAMIMPSEITMGRRTAVG